MCVCVCILKYKSIGFHLARVCAMVSIVCPAF